MSYPILGDSPSLYERPKGEQIHLKDTPLEKSNAGFPTNTPTDPNPVVPSDGGSLGHVVRDRGRRYHHQFSRREDCSEKGWGPECFPYGEKHKRGSSPPLQRLRGVLAKITQIRELSVGYIVDSNLPFATLESTYLQELFRQFNPDLCCHAPWGRTTVRKDLGDIFTQKKASVRKELDEAITQIHISFDLWTSPNRLAFISIFGHFLDKKHLYRSRLLAFRRQVGSHAGENIAFTIKSVIRDWEIDSKLGVSICDNASSNDSCLRSLYTSLDASITRANTEARRMRYFRHILNLVALSFLYGEDAASFELQSEAYGLLQQVEEDLEHWRAKGPVSKLHNIIKFIRASPQRTEAFKAHAREQEEAEVYKLAEESTAELEVIQNNSTRWNSTYMIIERALLKQSELNSFIQELGLEADASKRAPTADILTSDDWKVLKEIHHILEPIYHMTIRTQRWGTSSGHGRLWEVMTGMEFILDYLEDWKALYEEKPAYLAVEAGLASQGEGSPSPTPSQNLQALGVIILFSNRITPPSKTKLPSKETHYQLKYKID